MRLGIYMSIEGQGAGDESLNPDEYCLAEMLRDQLGYETKILGKRHLGTRFAQEKESYGFDRWYWESDPMSTRASQQADLAIDFINQNLSKPFFLYCAHTAPHVPIYEASYEAAVEEIDTSTGRILDHLASVGLDNNTWVIFYSDNGPWLEKGADGGSADPLRGGKFSTWEGGHRVPCVMRWPGTIPAGRVCSDVVAAVDLFPTIAGVVGGDLPTHVRYTNGTTKPWVIDGKDAWPLIVGEVGATSQHEAIFYQQLWDTNYGAVNHVGAMRMGKWKYFPNRNELYDLSVDIGETTNVYSANPTVVAQMDPLFNAYLSDIQVSNNGRPVYKENTPPMRYEPLFQGTPVRRRLPGRAGSLSTGGNRRASYDLRGRHASPRGAGVWVNGSGQRRVRLDH
jgi:arylsulfatase